MSERHQESPIRPRKSVSQSRISHSARKDGSTGRQQSPPPKKARLNKSIKDDTPQYVCRWMDCEFSGEPHFSTIDQLRLHCENAHFRVHEEETLPKKHKRTRRNLQLESPFMEASQTSSNETTQPKDILVQQTNNLTENCDAEEDIDIDLPGPDVVSNSEPPNEISSISGAAVSTKSTISSANLNLSYLSKNPHDLMKHFTKYHGEQYVKIMEMRPKLEKREEERNYIQTEHGRLHLMPPEFTKSHLVPGDISKEVNGRFYIDRMNSLMLNSEIIAVLVPADTGKIRLKIRWTPPGYIDDEWIDYSELPRNIMQLLPHRFTIEIDKLRKHQQTNYNNATLNASFKKDKLL